MRLSLEGRVIDERLVRLTEHEPRRKVKFEFTPQRVGQYAYVVSVPARDEALSEV